MTQQSFANNRSALMVSGLAVLMGLSLAGGPATAQEGNSKQREDARTCESFGTRYGTPAFTDCMVTQQQRRDTKQLKSLEETLMVSQLAKDGQIMAERARRQRCDRNPDRRECGRR